MRFNPYHIAKKNNLDYIGDINIEYGGAFYNVNLTDFKHGYSTALVITDLDSATGFDGAIMLENVTVNGTLDKARVKSAMDCCGIDPHSDDWRALTPESKRLMIVDALRSYGYTYNDTSQVYQPDRTQPDKYDGWQAERTNWTKLFQLIRRACANL